MSKDSVMTERVPLGYSNFLNSVTNSIQLLLPLLLITIIIENQPLRAGSSEDFKGPNITKKYSKEFCLAVKSGQ